MLVVLLRPKRVKSPQMHTISDAKSLRLAVQVPELCGGANLRYGRYCRYGAYCRYGRYWSAPRY